MARSILVLALLSTVAGAMRVKHYVTENGSHLETNATETVPGALSMPHPMQMQGGGALFPDLRQFPNAVVNGGNFPHRWSSGMSEYHPDLPADWKSAGGTGGFQPNGPPKVPVDIDEVFSGWSESVKREGLGAIEKGIYPLMQYSQYQASVMQAEIAAHSPDFVFGMAFGGNYYSVKDKLKAIATVRFQSEWDPSGKLTDLALSQGLVSGADATYDVEAGGRIEVVRIDRIVEAPEAMQKGVACELLKGIINWAKLLGKLVTINPSSPEERAYYESIGFELADDAGPGAALLVYCGSHGVSNTGRTGHPPMTGTLLDLQPPSQSWWRF